MVRRPFLLIATLTMTTSSCKVEQCPEVAGDGDTPLEEPVDPELQMLVDECRAVDGRGTECLELCREVSLRVLAPWGPPADPAFYWCELVEDDDPATPQTATVRWGFQQCAE